MTNLGDPDRRSALDRLQRRLELPIDLRSTGRIRWSTDLPATPAAAAQFMTVIELLGAASRRLLLPYPAAEDVAAGLSEFIAELTALGPDAWLADSPPHSAPRLAELLDSYEGISDSIVDSTETDRADPKVGEALAAVGRSVERLRRQLHRRVEASYRGVPSSARSWEPTIAALRRLTRDLDRLLDLPELYPALGSIRLHSLVSGSLTSEVSGAVAQLAEAVVAAAGIPQQHRRGKIENNHLAFMNIIEQLDAVSQRYELLGPAAVQIIHNLAAALVEISSRELSWRARHRVSELTAVRALAVEQITTAFNRLSALEAAANQLTPAEDGRPHLPGGGSGPT